MKREGKNTMKSLLKKLINNNKNSNTKKQNKNSQMLTEKLPILLIVAIKNIKLEAIIKIFRTETLMMG